MMHHVFQKTDRWLLPVVLVLFILQLALLPWVVGSTWADRSDVPSNKLLYNHGKLKWQSSTNILPNGSAQLKLFNTNYGDVVSGSQDHVIAPGTEQDMLVRLQSETYAPIEFTAVLYQISSDDRIPVTAILAEDTKFTKADTYPMPWGVKKEQVLRSVTGLIMPYSAQDFSVSWEWDFEESELQDFIDTELGNLDPLPEVSVGLYIVVEDESDFTSPKTGDDTNIELYLTVMIVSFVLLVLLIWERILEKKCEDDQMDI